MSPSNVLPRAVARFLLLPIGMISAALFVKGLSSTGDGFIAGTVAALGIVLQDVVFGHREAERLLPVRRAPLAAAVGLALGLAVAFAPLLFGDPVLTHLPPAEEKVAKLGTLELATSVAFDAAVFLTVFGVVVGIVRELAWAAEREGEG